MAKGHVATYVHDVRSSSSPSFPSRLTMAMVLELRPACGEAIHFFPFSSSPPNIANQLLTSQLVISSSSFSSSIDFLAVFEKKICFPGRIGAMAYLRPAPSTLLFLLLACSTSIFPSFVSSELVKLRHPIVKSDGSLSAIVFGDWGRHGEYNQSQVAFQMGKVAEELDIDFVISTGDNFYEDGLRGVDDEQFEDSFLNIYTAESLQKQWYIVLGNHDYRGDVLAQISPVLHSLDSRWLCLRSFVVQAEIVDIFFVDTTPFVLKYWDHPGDDRYDWREVEPRDQYISNLLKDLDSALKESTASWRFVVGHHTMRSVSEHGDTSELLQELLPVIKANEVDLYINGHDHCLEHISSKDGQTRYITSGGGSKAWRGVYTPNADELQFFYDGQGFMTLQVTTTDIKLVFYDVSGVVLHQWCASKGLRASV